MKRALIIGVTGQDGSYLAELARGGVGLDWQRHVVLDDAFRRPAEVGMLVGDASKAKRELGWEPRTNLEQLIRLMVDADSRLLAGE
jgi:GDPmannose 4,6-dehydratase